MAQESDILQRRDDVLQAIVKQGFVSLGDLSTGFGVSESTIRRDLEVLEQRGSVRRTHGGAVSLTETSAGRLAYAERESAAAAEKKAIATAVARLVPDEHAVIIDGGTTCYQVALALVGRRLSVVTNSVPIAAALGREVDTEVTLVGGYLYPRTGVALGPKAEGMLAGLRANQLVLSCSAVNPDGVFNANEIMAAVERRMIEVADEVILAADHTKFGKRSIAPVCDWSQVDVVVTDSGLDAESRTWLEKVGVKVVYG